jgi:hypothetical protein
MPARAHLVDKINRRIMGGYMLEDVLASERSYQPLLRLTTPTTSSIRNISTLIYIFRSLSQEVLLKPAILVEHRRGTWR